MSLEHAHVADWDAAYVLGALSSADRYAFEAHLEDCGQCRRAVAEIAPMAGLLGRIDKEHAESLLVENPAGPDPAARADFARLGTRERMRRRRRRWSRALAAAAAVVVAVALVTAIGSSLSEGTVVAFESSADVPLEATVKLEQTEWGTRIELDCHYGGSADGYNVERPYALYVIAKDSTEVQASSWRARPGTSAHLTTATALNPDEIVALELRSIDSGQVLMHADLTD
jgi:Putative zinc-finger